MSGDWRLDGQTYFVYRYERRDSLPCYRASCFSNRKSINCVGFYCPSFWDKYFSVFRAFVWVDLNILLLGLCWTNTDQTDLTHWAARHKSSNSRQTREACDCEMCISFSSDHLSLMNKVLLLKVRSGSRLHFVKEYGIWLKNFPSQSLWFTWIDICC